MWFDIYIYYKLITTISLATICHQSQYSQLYSLYCTLQPYNIYFTTASLYLLIFFTYFAQHCRPLPLVITIFFVSMSLFLFPFICSFGFLDSTCKWNHTVFVFIWLISLSITLSRSFCVVPHGKIAFFLWLSNVPLHIPILHLHYPFINRHWVASISWLLEWMFQLIYHFQSQEKVPLDSWLSGYILNQSMNLLTESRHFTSCCFCARTQSK